MVVQRLVECSHPCEGPQKCIAHLQSKIEGQFWWRTSRCVLNDNNNKINNVIHSQTQQYVLFGLIGY